MCVCVCKLYIVIGQYNANSYLAYSESVNRLSYHTLAQQIVSKQMMAYLSVTAKKPTSVLVAD